MRLRLNAMIMPDQADTLHRSNEAGQLAYERYFHLVSGGLPFVRASGMQRVVDTAGNWSLGLCFLQYF